MNKIQRYIIKEILPVFIMGNFLFIFLLLLERLVTLADLFFAKSVPIYILAETIIYFLPSLLAMTIPLASLLAVLIAFSRLSSDSELIAMRASGASGKDLLKPVAIFGLFSALLGILMSVYLVEKGSKLAANNLNKIVENISISDLKENEMYENIPGIMLFVKRKLSNTDFEGIIVVNKSDGSIVTSSRGSISPTDTRTIEMNFQNGRITLISKEKETTSISFENMIFNMPMNIAISSVLDTPMTMGIKRLAEISGKNKKAAFELSKRFAVPLSSLIMSMFGFSLGIFLSRSGKSIGIIISIGIAFLYNFIMLYLENMADKSGINPFLAPWLPNIAFSLLLIYIMRRSFR